MAFRNDSRSPPRVPGFNWDISCPTCSSSPALSTKYNWLSRHSKKTPCFDDILARGVGLRIGILTASWTVTNKQKKSAAVVIVTMSQNDTISISGSPLCFLRLGMFSVVRNCQRLFAFVPVNLKVGIDGVIPHVNGAFLNQIAHRAVKLHRFRSNHHNDVLIFLVLLDLV